MHIATRIIVTCQDERLKIKNYEKELKVFHLHLYILEYIKQVNDIKNQIREMVKRGEHTDKIRTYNYP